MDTLAKLKDLCSRRECCRKEVFEKALSQGCSQTEADKIVETLVEQKFVDDRRYAEAFVRDKLRFNKWGKIKIVYILRSQDIDRKIIDDILSEIDYKQYKEILRHELEKKYKSGVQGSIYEIKGKLFRFATSKGFESYVVGEEISQLLSKK